MDLLDSPAFAPHVEELMDQHRVPGLAIAIVHQDRIVSAGYGKASLQPPTPCTPDTIFDVASCSKSLTAASVALLVHDNNKYPEVQYDATMSSLLPDDFVMSGIGYTEGVTVEDVLSHRTGMAAHDSSYMGPQAAHPDDARSVTRNLRNLPVAAPLRSRYLYCNMMYTVATHLVEVKSQQVFSEYLREQLFQPLGMQSTFLQPGAARMNGFGERLATGYHWDKQSATYRGFQSSDCPEAQGAGSIVSCVNDFIKWVKALLHHEGPINDKIYQGLVRQRSFPNPNGWRLRPHTSPAFYAAGIETYYYRGHAVVGHDGVVSGFASRFFFLPDLGFGAVISTNSTEGAAVASILAREMIDDVLKVPETERRQQQNKRVKTTVGQITDGISALTHDPKVKPKNKSKDGLKDQSKEKKGHGKDKEKKSEKKPQQQSHSSRGQKPQQLQETALTAYIGAYWHPGYHTMTVQIKDDQLFIDATDRSMSFTLTFYHVSDQKKYRAQLYDPLDGEVEDVPAEFVFTSGKAVKMGLHLENTVKEMIWFEKVMEDSH